MPEIQSDVQPATGTEAPPVEYSTAEYAPHAPAFEIPPKPECSACDGLMSPDAITIKTSTKRAECYTEVKQTCPHCGDERLMMFRLVGGRWVQQAASAPTIARRGRRCIAAA